MRAAFALRIISGKFILNFGVLKSLRTFQNPFFTGGVWNEPSQALPRQLPRRGSQAVNLVAKVLGVMRKFLAMLLPLPLGEVDLRSKDGEGAHR